MSAGTISYSLPLLRYMRMLFLVFTGVLVPLASVMAESSSGHSIILSGAGATFPRLLYEKWFAVYESRKTLRFSYEAIGSGGGITRLCERSVDFGATDAFLSDEELSECPSGILHIPTCVSAVAIVHSLNFSGQALRLTPEILSDIFRGDITKWSDRRIRRLNPNVRLPRLRIKVVHRSDSSGTTFIMTDYLAKTDATWGKKIGRGKLVEWPTGMGVEGNANVAEFVQKIDGSIGYVSLAYALSHDLPYCLLLNRSGQFVAPTLATVSTAANVELPEECRILITDTSAEGGYPISAFSYLIVYQNQAYNGRTRERGKALAEFLWWVAHDGQAYNEALNYAPLPGTAVRRCEDIIKRLAHNSEKLLKTE